MSIEGKVTDIMAARKFVNTKILDGVLERIDPIVYAATGVHPKMQDFVTDAVLEKLAYYESMAEEKRAAESKHRKKEAS